MNIWFIPFLAFAALVFRYSLVSVLPYEIFWNWKKLKFAHLRIQKTFPKSFQLWNEVKWSVFTFVIFSLGALYFYPIILSGKSKLYFDADQMGWGYLFLSFIILVIAHDTYFYWAHRFMHLKWVFKHVHRIHHLSTNPSPLAAFSFHPLEALIEGGFIWMMVFALPLHIGVLFSFLLFSHLMNVLGHLGYEVFPSGFSKKTFLGYILTSTHHNMHHRLFNYNYGFYFNFWDKLMKTNHSDYDLAFEEVAGGHNKQLKSIIGKTQVKLS